MNSGANTAIDKSPPPARTGTGFALSVRRAACSILLLASGLALTGRVRAELIYDNSGPSTNFFPSPFEYGDEIGLAGVSRIATVFQVEYYGDFTPSGNENGRIRFYANDGPGPPGAHMPGNLLYDSGPFSLFPGYNTVTLSGFSVIVPDDFTWSVQFSGLSGSVGSTAGLLLSPVPSVGRSYRDFWLKGGSGWQLLEINGGDLKANFGARLYATQDLTIHLSAPVTLGNGANQFQISGPYGRTCILQATSDLITWHSLSRVTFPSAPFLFTDPQGLSLNRRFYRAVLVSDDPMTVGAPTRSTNGQVQVQVFGPSGFNYILQASADLVHWSGLVTNTFTTRPVQVLDTSAPAFGKRFYRTVLGP